MVKNQADLFDDLRDTMTPEQCSECLWLVLKLDPQYRKSPRTQILIQRLSQELKKMYAKESSVSSKLGRSA